MPASAPSPCESFRPGPILAIEASQRVASVALSSSGGRNGEGAIDSEPVGPAGVGEDLVPAIDRLLHRHGLAPRTIGAVVVSTGPGGFTGLRVSLAVAKTLAMTTGAALVGVPTAVIAAGGAEGLSIEVRSLCVLLAIKRAGGGASAWVEKFSRSAGSAQWHSDGPARVRPISGSADSNPPDLLQPAEADCFILDLEAAPEWTASCAAAGRPCHGLGLSAAECLRVGQQRLVDGRTVAPPELLPIYAREPEAVTLWKARYGD